MTHTHTMAQAQQQEQTHIPDSIFMLAAIRVRDMVINGKIPYKNLGNVLIPSCKSLVQDLLIEYDREQCRKKLMAPLVKLELKGADECFGEWEKFYDKDGNKDFAQVLYIQRGKIKKITPWNSPFYDEYIEAYREMFPEDEEELCQDLLEDWDFYNSDEEEDI